MHIDIHDEIWNNCYNYVLINGGDEKDIVVNKANKAIIKTGALNDLIKNYGDSVTIDGGEDNDKLYGGADNDCIKGGTGNDLLWGGTGNDSLWGDAGADKFFYSKGDGKDVIFGFDSKDTLTFDNIIFKTSMASYNKSEGTLTLNLSGGSVTLKDFTTSTFHINSDIYKINGSTLKKQ